MNKPFQKLWHSRNPECAHKRLNRDGSNMQTSICERICGMDWVGGMKIMLEGGQKKIFGDRGKMGLGLKAKGEV